MSIFAAVSRWRLWILGGALVVGALLQVNRVLSLAGFLLVLGLIVLGVVAQAKYRPAEMVSRPESDELVSVPNPGPVFSASGFTILGVSLVSDDVVDLVRGNDIWWGDPASSLLWVALVGFWWYLALGPWGVRVRPDGVADRQPLGSVFVPWAALDPGLPIVPGGQNQVFLHFSEPDRVVRRGLRRPKPNILNPQSDAGYVAATINARWRAAGGPA
ncbi:hypothetical protein JIG36_13890 [Actinoplanes sp. LDG1-06]|uniref:Uncharacterized protein n=1 Tax=Paractinoplanes ovalisporus TaxID=2810368 RepID=A0ABS2AA00_9ACTN|nr:hypothetical protein [Actinoplanes ovalisporus]MBM2616652.1 hypothetical protein [Actinoplanes ovalisporus]